MARLDLRDKTVVITGASGGIGSETAVAFARRGSRLVLSGRNLEALEKVADRVKSMGAEAHVVPADVTSFEEIKALADKAIELTGGLHVMMLSAGFGFLSGVENITLEMWHQQMDVNFWGVIHGFYAALPHFIKQGSGQYIIINSLQGKLAMALSSTYCVSKFALWGFADSLRPELAKKNIGMLSVYPYFVKTTFQANIKSPDFKVPPDLAWKMFGQSPEKLSKQIVRATERRQGEILCTPIGKIGVRLVPLSFHMAERTRRLMLLITRKVLGAK